MSTYFQKGLDRRRLLQVWGLAGMGVLISGCAGPGSGSQEELNPPEDGEAEGSLSFAHWRAEDNEAFDDIIADFVDTHSDVTVSQNISPSDDYQATALQRIRGGEIGDLFAAFRGKQFVDMVSAGVFTDLTDQPYVQNYIEELIDAGKDSDRQLGLPYQMVFNTPLVNRELLEENGFTDLPEDWDGFLEMCEELNGNGIVPIAFPGGDSGNVGQLLNCMVMNNAPDEEMFTKIESGEYKVTDDWFIKTLEQYAELRPYVQPNAAGTAMEPAQQLFAQGDAAMLASGSFHIGAVRGLGAEFPIDLCAPITVAADEARYVGSHNATFILGVNSASENQATAAEFLAYLSEPEVAAVYADSTQQHVTVDGVDYTDPDLQALEPWLSKTTLLSPRFQFEDLDISGAVDNTTVEVIGGKSPDQAAEEAQRIIDQRRE